MASLEKKILKKNKDTGKHPIAGKSQHEFAFTKVQLEGKELGF